MSERSASGHGLATIHEASGRVLEAYYPEPRLGAPTGDTSELTGARDERRGVRTEPVTTEIEALDAPRAAVADAYLRLQLISHRLVRPREVNLDGIFGVLPNVAWTSHGPVDPADLP